jgi:hypothetical protein
MTQKQKTQIINEMSKEIYETVIDIVKDCKDNKYCYYEVAKDFEYDIDVSDILFIIIEILEQYDLFPNIKHILYEFLSYL